MHRLIRLWIPAALALSSAASMALEIVAGRMLAPYVGMSLYSWTAIIAVVLAGLSLGHLVGGWISDRARDLRRAAGHALAAAAVSSLASLWILRAAAAPALEALAPVPAIGALALAAFFLPSLCAGVVSPVLTRLALSHAAPERQGRVLGTMFALGAAGAILGTVAAGFWLIATLGSARSVLAIAALYALLALPGYGGAARAVPLALLLATGVGFGTVATPCERESAYYCLRTDAVPVPAGAARVLALDHLAHGVNDRDDPERLHSPYIQLVDEIVRRRFQTGPRAAYFIGGGAYTLPRAWAHRWPEAHISVAEIDPAVTRLAADRLWLDPAGMEILHADARRALAEMPHERRFDVIFGDAFHDVTVPPHLVTDEFHRALRGRLTPDGIYALNIVEALRRPPFLLSLVETLSARFPVVELWLHAESLAQDERRTVWIVIAAGQPTGTDRIDAPDPAGPGERTWLRVPTAAMLSVVAPEDRVFLTDDHAPVARLMAHITLDPALAE